MQNEMETGPKIKLWVSPNCRNKEKGNLKRTGRRKTRRMWYYRSQEKIFQGENGQQ